jgi:hypothetical protein
MEHLCRIVLVFNIEVKLRRSVLVYQAQLELEDAKTKNLGTPKNRIETKYIKINASLCSMYLGVVYVRNDRSPQQSKIPKAKA